METVKKIVSSVASDLSLSSKFPLPGQDNWSGSPSPSTDKPANPVGTQTLMSGQPLANNANSLTVGRDGPVLLQDTPLLEKHQHWNRERIPERNVHARGCGAFGTFTVTNDITKYTKAKLFSKVGTTTPIAVRFSSAIGGKDEGDMHLREPKGFAVKFYTEEGNWDLVANNLPVFFIRDSYKFPDVIRVFKKDPRNNVRNPTAMWDFMSLNPESTHMITMIYSDRGIPLTYRFMHGYGSNTFSFINSENKRFWVKFHMLSEQGIRNFDRTEAGLMHGQDTDFFVRDLWDSIERKDFPKWKLCVQIMPEEVGFQNPAAFDVTKVWLHKDFPLLEIGTFELNKNPINFHAEVEQMAFSPSNVVPGIGFSPDKNLQGRLFAYKDTQLYRLGANYQQLPVNASQNNKPLTYDQQGLMDFYNCNRAPNYEPNSFGGAVPDPSLSEPPLKVFGSIDRYSQYKGDESDYYEAPRRLFNLLTSEEQRRLCDNIAQSLETIPENIRNRQMQHFYKTDKKYGSLVEEMLKLRLSGRVEKTEAEAVREKLIASVKSTKGPMSRAQVLKSIDSSVNKMPAEVTGIETKIPASKIHEQISVTTGKAIPSKMT